MDRRYQSFSSRNNSHCAEVIWVFAGRASYYLSLEDTTFCLTLTLLLFPPLPPVADLDGADAHDDGHDEEEDAANQAGRDGAPLHVLRHCISGQSLWCRVFVLRGFYLLIPEWITLCVGCGWVRIDSEHIGLSRAHVLNWKKAIEWIASRIYVSRKNWVILLAFSVMVSILR